jgi:serine/threonine protein kinase
MGLLRRGQKLGPFVLHEILGTGGMGDVWRAHQKVATGSRTVVVKVVKDELVHNKKAIEMFLREARMASQLDHANIVKTYELGRDGETYFLAMEHLDGLAWHDLAQRMWRHGQTIPMETIVRAAAEAAFALDHAHRRGIVHRDVSPDNLFLTRDGNTKVLDFGIAKAISNPTNLTDMGELRGKLPYMPPEQANGSTVDGRADQWALGVTLYYLSTAQRPFDRDSPIDTVQAIMHDTPVAARQMNPLVPQSLSDLIHRALQKDPRQRFSSAHAMHDALMRLLPGPVDDDSLLQMLAEAEGLERGERRALVAAPAAPRLAWPEWPARVAPKRGAPWALLQQQTVDTAIQEYVHNDTSSDSIVGFRGLDSTEGASDERFGLGGGGAFSDPTELVRGPMTDVRERAAGFMSQGETNVAPPPPRRAPMVSEWIGQPSEDTFEASTVFSPALGEAPDEELATALRQSLRSPSAVPDPVLVVPPLRAPSVLPQPVLAAPIATRPALRAWLVGVGAGALTLIIIGIVGVLLVNRR